jgi:hypothetical protein
MKDQIEKWNTAFFKSCCVYLSGGDFMWLEPETCWKLPLLQLPNGEHLTWQRAQLSILLELATTYGVVRMSFNRLPRHFSTEGRSAEGERNV